MAALEELDQVEVRANAHDQPGALLVREEHRDVLARADRAENQMVEAQVLETPGSGRAAVRVRVDDQLGARAKRGIARRVHVAQHHVRLPAGLE
jgi:hypothetical protein